MKTSETVRAWAKHWNININRGGQIDAVALWDLEERVASLTKERDLLVRVLDTTTDSRNRLGEALEEIAAGEEAAGIDWRDRYYTLRKIAKDALSDKENHCHNPAAKCACPCAGERGAELTEALEWSIYQHSPYRRTRGGWLECFYCNALVSDEDSRSAAPHGPSCKWGYAVRLLTEPQGA